MHDSKEKKYPLFSNLDEAALEPNNTLKMMLTSIEGNERVIDFGCATGYFAELLNKKGCSVVGVEINPTAAKEAEKHCQKVIVADLDFVSLTEILDKEEKFDVAVFGDVLEHLRNPWKILQETKKILSSQGYIVASIPNIAHGSIRLALLQGKFEYTEIGILDDTHLRFFTRETVEDLFERSGYVIEQVKQTKVPIFSDSSVIPNLNESDFESSLVKKIQQEEEADTLQFIIKAHPISSDRVFDISRQTKLELKSTTIKLQETQRELEQNQTQLQQVEREYQQSQNQLEQAQQALAANQNQLEQAQQEWQTTQTQLEQAQQEWQTTQTQLEQAQQEWQQATTTIAAMESSKFWILRRVWFKLKEKMGLKID